MPIPGRASTSSDALAGECIGDCVILTVDVTNEPGAAGGLTHHAAGGLNHDSPMTHS